MSLTNCLIVESDQEIAQKIYGYLSGVGKIILRSEVGKLADIVKICQETEVELFVVNFELFGQSEIEIVSAQLADIQVIVMSRCQFDAVSAYELGVSDFLLKPFKMERFSLAIDRALFKIEMKRNWLQQQQSKATKKDNDQHKNYILVRSAYKLIKVALSDIFYIQSMREYVAFYTSKGRIMSLMSLKELEVELPSTRFLRIHKSYIVALDKIEIIRKNQIHVQNIKLPVGATYKSRVVAEVIEG